jgi:hypothetical protein
MPSFRRGPVSFQARPKQKRMALKIIGVEEVMETYNHALKRQFENRTKMPAWDF